jgi:hypothetical protein
VPRNERFCNSDIFRRVFERVVGACITAGLVGGEGFAVDASLIVADANKQRSIPGKERDKKRDGETASRAVKEYLATWTTRPSARQATWSRSSSHPPIRSLRYGSP